METDGENASVDGTTQQGKETDLGKNTGRETKHTHSQSESQNVEVHEQDEAERDEGDLSAGWETARLGKRARLS